jgi:hypothetical protein
VSTDAEVVAELVDDMEEYWDAFDHYPLYLLVWGQDRGSHPPSDLMITRAHQALDAFRATHRTRVVWVRSVVDTDQSWPVEDAAPLVFDRDPNGPDDELMMVIVPSDEPTS